MQTVLVTAARNTVTRGIWALVGFAILCGSVSAQSLRGSAASLDRQALEAMRHDYSYLSDPGQVRRFVNAGLLVPVNGNQNYSLKDVSFPFARPAVLLFIERLAAQYRQACDQRLVVTSLTRPRSHQPRNASTRSVHPTGMALDLRRARIGPTCRSWLERTLLSLERQAVLEATVERRPPHYHVVIFPKPYMAYVDRLDNGSVVATTARVHVVRRGESLWRIARRHGLSAGLLRRLNGLSSSRIHPGQTLRLPALD